MGSPVSLRDDFDAAELRSLARRTRDACPSFKFRPTQKSMPFRVI